MKILNKFRISNSFDNGRGLPASLRAKIAASAELSAYLKESAAVDRALRRPSLPPADPSLHRGIMRAVRAVATEPAPRRAAPGLGWAAAAALAVVAMMGVWLALPRALPRQVTAAEPTPLATVTAAIELGGQISQRMPAEVIAPLSNEWAQVDDDLRGASRVILSSMP